VDASYENEAGDLHDYESRGSRVHAWLGKVISLKNRTLHLAHWVLDPPKKTTLNGNSRKRIAYIKRGRWSYINLSIIKLLAEKFPEYDVEAIDMVDDILRQNKKVILANLFHIFRLYGRDILRGRRSVHSCFYRTPYIFNKTKQLVRDRIAGNTARYAFTFQTQSLYDASVEGLPHFVYTDHTHLSNLLYPAFERKKLFSREWIDLERNIYRNALRIFIMSSHVKQSVVQHYACDSERVSCVFAGCNIEFRPLLLDNDDYRNKRILFIGVDWERKGGPELVEAFKLVLKKIPDARLTIVGCSPNIRHPQIDVIGRVPIRSINQYLIQASLLCLPTKIEPFGIVTIEAFIHKLPVVATRIGALPDLVVDGKSGRLVAPDDIRGLADALGELLSDPEKCRNFGEHGYQIVKDNYSWEAVGTRLRHEIMSTFHD
jgi:glycosyltransferase involved in cell wall biosynthesis